MPPLSADDRLRRILAVVPWVAAHDGPSIAEVCTRFGLTEKELLADLDLLFLCGLHPYTPDMLIEVEIADGRVWIRYAEYFARPLRLTPAEGLALVAAGRTLLATPGSDPDGPLARGLAKLAKALGIDDPASLDIDLGSAEEATLTALRRAADEHRAVDLAYYSFGRDEWTQRVVEPHAVFNAAGQWYVSGHCRNVADDRLFRVDRIRSVVVTDETFTPPAEPRELAVYSPRDGDPRVVLDLEPAAAWVVGQYPVEQVESRAGGVTRVTLAVSEDAWLDRLLLRLGRSATIVDGAPPDRACGAATRLLRRYGVR
jgi:proteasome accessory factor C